MLQQWNVLIVIQSLSGGGAELVVENLCRNIDLRIFHVSVCYLRESGERGDSLVEAGFDVFGLEEQKNIFGKYMAFIELAKVIKSRSVDIVHSHSLDALIQCGQARLLVPRAKFVHTFHFGNYPNLPRRYLMLELVSSRFMNKLIAVGEVQKEAIQRAYKIPNKRIMSIWNGVERKPPRVALDLVGSYFHDDVVIVGTFSTLIEQKGISYLLDVAHVLKGRGVKVRFLVVGAGPLYRELTEKCRRLNLEDIVVFLGWVKDAASRILPICDIVFQPSLWEAMSMVVLEAMFAGKPIVASDVGDNSRIIRHGCDGFLAKPRDVDGMAASIEVLVLSDELRKEMGLKARKKAEDAFTARKMALKYEAVYMGLLRAGKLAV